MGIVSAGHLKMNAMNWISTEHGHGRIIRTGKHPNGCRWWLVALPGIGRTFITRRDVRYFFKFSLN